MFFSKYLFNFSKIKKDRFSYNKTKKICKKKKK